MKKMIAVALLLVGSIAHADSTGLPIRGTALHLVPQAGAPPSACAVTGQVCIWYDSISASWKQRNASGSDSALGGGSVSSVALTLPSWLQVSGSPITSSGTLAVTAAGGQTANMMLATPNGSSGAVSLRALVDADMPAHVADCTPTTSGDYCSWSGAVWQRTAAPSGAVSSVANSDSTLTVSPTTGAVVASLNLGHVNNFTKDQGTAGFALTDAATIAVDCSQGNLFKVTLGGNRTLGAPTNCLDGHTYQFRFKQDSTGGRTVVYASAYKFPSGTVPTLTTAASAVDYVTCTYDGDASAMDCVFQGNFQ